jgi:CBS domain-containing protein
MIFNLLPAFPMDGGRVLRALLAMLTRKSKATKIAATIGQGMALLIGLMGFFGNPMLIVIAAFIFIAAGSEAETAAFHDITQDLTIRDAMLEAPARLRPSDTIRNAIDHLLGSTENEFLVIDKANPEIGTITRDMLLLALASHDDGTQISALMSQPEHVVYENEPLEKALTIFEGGSDQALIVKNTNQDISGLISRAAIAQAILIKSARPDWKFYRGGILANSLPTVSRGQRVASLLP